MSFALPLPAATPGPSLDLLPERRLKQCLLLALLLHVWLVLLLGNTPGGSARPGEGVWGSLSVRLRGDEAADKTPGPPRPAPAAEAPVAPQRNVGAVGEAKSERFGGAVRREGEEAEALPKTPGAARLGQWNQQDTGRLLEEPAAAAPIAQQLPAPSRLDAPRPLPELARPAVSAAPAVEALPQPPSLPPQVTAELPAPSRALERAAEALPRLAAPAAAPLEALPAAPRAPRLPAAMPEPLAPSRAVMPPTLAPAEALSRALPELPPQVTSTLPAPSASPSRVAPAETSAPLAPLAGVPDERPQALPEAPSLPAPRPTQFATPSSTSRATLEHGRDQQALQPLAAEPAPSLLPAVPAPSLLGAPDAGSRVGQDVATPPSTPASAPPPKLNLNLPRSGEVSGRSSRGVLQLIPHPPERKNKLQEGIENAARKDCREAHADKGLVAALPLVLGAASDKGCRW
ncbi:hypothetical protein G8A07_15905 [Roseateles sp. DAIF2]|uniref:hypothetical protein n=1 Tax=Roseateles sp. DAIF2 TaxID=2714952 RepID=UPI0018A321C9|nr:hypothetical protein [Roseateles sp. DAIF2]QPF74258.1 hypothetical protein G8A07_15905 [Roseateles sp. DAIF2]